MSRLARRVWSKVERRRRAVARTALYTSFVLVTLAGWAGARLVQRPTIGRYEQAWSQIDFGAYPEVQLLQRYVRIDTSDTTGSETAGAELLAEQLRRSGAVPVLDRVDDRHANLWAIIEGESPRAIVLHSHLDVAPVDPAQWNYPPFGGDIYGPWLRGRGTFDMKSVAIAQLLAFQDVLASHRRPRTSLIFLATSSEEHGSQPGIVRVLAQHPELKERFAAMLTEGGALEARSLDDIKYWGIEFAQRRVVEVSALSPNRERLETLRRALDSEGLRSGKPRICDETRTFLAAYAGSRDRGDFQNEFSDPSRLIVDGKVAEEVPPVVRELLSDQLATKAVVPRPAGGYELPLVFLLLPDSDWDAAREELLPADQLQGIELEGGPVHGPARGSPLDNPVYLAMRRALSDLSGRAPVGPYMLGHTMTDSRFVRAMGIPSYGFSPFMILSTDTYRVDKANEQMGLPGYVVGVRAYRKLVQEIVQQPPPPLLSQH